MNISPFDGGLGLALGMLLYWSADRIAFARAELRHARALSEKDSLIHHLEGLNVSRFAFLQDVMASVTEGKLRLCETVEGLPEPLPMCGETTAIGKSEDLMPLRHRVQDSATRLGLSDLRVSDIVTATGEAAMNAVVHGGGGEGTVCVGDGKIQVWVEDQGAGISLSDLPLAALQRGYSTAGSLGYGFWMILRTCDRVYIATDPSGTQVVLEMDLAGSSTAISSALNRLDIALGDGP